MRMKIWGSLMMSEVSHLGSDSQFVANLIEATRHGVWS